MRKVIVITMFILLCTKAIAGTVEVVTVDIIKQEGYIFICDAKTRSIIFEFNKDKKVDHPDWEVFNSVLIEARGKEINGEPTATYRRYSDKSGIKEILDSKKE